MKQIVLKCVIGVLGIIGLVVLSVYNSKHFSKSEAELPVFIITAFNEYGSISGTVFTHEISYVKEGVLGCVDMDSGKFVEIPFKNFQVEDVGKEYNAQHRCLKCYEGESR